MKTMPIKSRGMFVCLAAILILGVIGCNGSSSTNEPTMLSVTITDQSGHSSVFSAQHPASIGSLYDHVRALSKVSSGARSCPPVTSVYVFTFSSGTTTDLIGTIGKCGTLDLSDNTERIVDTQFWQKVDEVVGQNIEPSGTFSS